MICQLTRPMQRLISSAGGDVVKLRQKMALHPVGLFFSWDDCYINLCSSESFHHNVDDFI